MIIEKLKNLVVNNKDAIISVLTTGAAIYAYRKFNISPVFGRVDICNSSPDITFSRNPTEAAIAALYSSAKDMTWDSEKMKTAQKIVKLVKENEADEGTKTYAINVLNGISGTATWDSTKKIINDYILEVSKA